MNGHTGIPCGHNSSYSFMSILSKLHQYFGHGVKICLCLGYNPQTILLIFSQVKLSHIPSIILTKRMKGDTLWARLLLQFYTDSFETSLVFWLWSENMHVVWDIILRLFLLYKTSAEHLLLFTSIFAFSAINILSMSIHICSTFECKCSNTNSYFFCFYFMDYHLKFEEKEKKGGHQTNYLSRGPPPHISRIIQDKALRSLFFFVIYVIPYYLHEVILHYKAKKEYERQTI